MVPVVLAEPKTPKAKGSARLCGSQGRRVKLEVVIGNAGLLTNFEALQHLRKRRDERKGNERSQRRFKDRDVAAKKVETRAARVSSIRRLSPPPLHRAA